MRVVLMVIVVLVALDRADAGCRQSIEKKLTALLGDREVIDVFKQFDSNADHCMSPKEVSDNRTLSS